MMGQTATISSLEEQPDLASIQTFLDYTRHVPVLHSLAFLVEERERVVQIAWEYALACSSVFA